MLIVGSIAELRPLVLFLDPRVLVRGGWVLHPVVVALFDFVDLCRVVGDDRHLRLVHVPVGVVGHRRPVRFLPVGVARVGPAAPRVDAGDHVGPGGRRGVRRLVFVGSVGRDGCGEHQAQLVGEGAARRHQFDDDFAGLVIGLDAGDAALLGFGELFRADDLREEGRAAGVDLEEPFDGEREVGRLDGRAVRVFEPLAKVQRVGLAAVGDLGQALRQARDDLAARLAFGVRVGEQADVGVRHRRPAFCRVGELRVDVVGGFGIGHRQRAALLAAAVAATGGESERRSHRQPNYRKNCA